MRSPRCWRPPRRGPNAWHAHQTLRGVYDITGTETGVETVEQLADDFQDA
ncbi:MAG: hypothetical protein OXB92_12995 [Acidimicrobiaceae bacterium]|nr:hypothetical protein [Acidimicrobiia bacterium]MCY4494766.1 hypothetical protein [Acidimicrobiaceae bacterium]